MESRTVSAATARCGITYPPQDRLFEYFTIILHLFLSIHSFMDGNLLWDALLDNRGAHFRTRIHYTVFYSVQELVEKPNDFSSSPSRLRKRIRWFRRRQPIELEGQGRAGVSQVLAAERAPDFVIAFRTAAFPDPSKKCVVIGSNARFPRGQGGFPGSRPAF